MSPRRKVRSPARIGKSRISSTESKPPLTRSCTRSLPVSKKLAGVTAFCCVQRLLHRRAAGCPSVASLVFDSSIQIFSSCRPSRSTLADVGHALQLQLDALGVVLQHRVVEALAGQRVDVAEGVAEFVVEERPDARPAAGVGGCRRSSCAPGTRARGCRCECSESLAMNMHLRFARPRIGADELVLAGLHQFLFDAVGDLLADFLGGGARPEGAHHHHLEGERRIFRLAEALVADQAPISASTSIA